MSIHREVLRLDRLVDEFLHPFYGFDSDTLTEDVQKNLLLALSQVVKQVNQWKYGCISEELELVDDDTTPDSNCLKCLANIISNLIRLLAIKNQYAEHLIGNILFTIFEFLLTMDNAWYDFIDLMCYCAGLIIGNFCASSSEPVPHYDPSRAKSLLKARLKGANLSTAAALFRVLHKIQKYLKRDSDQPMKGYLDCVRTLVLSLPSDIFRCMIDGRNESHKISGVDVIYPTQVSDLGEQTMLFGDFIQLLCSLVSQNCFVEDENGCPSVIYKIVDLIPNLASWCLLKPQSCFSIRVSRYFRHKVLLLMVKLNYYQLEETVQVRCMHLLHENFEDLLLEPIHGFGFDEDGLLESSPFSTSVFTTEKQGIPSRHLQRLAIFLFLKCSLNLMSMSNELVTAKENVNRNSSANETLSAERVDRSLGSVKLCEWLLAHVPADIFSKSELYPEWCLQFSLSFLRLYIHEDDILFEVLLLLLRIPFHPYWQRTMDLPRKWGIS